VGLAAAAVAALPAPALPAPALAAYALEDLGPDTFRPLAINDAGVVVGGFAGSGPAQVYRSGTFTPLPQGSGTACAASDINAAGLAVGLCAYATAPFGSYAATWRIPPSGPIGAPFELPRLEDESRYAIGLGVGADGTVVGEAAERNPSAPPGSGAPPFRRAVIWRGSLISRLDGAGFGLSEEGTAYGVRLLPGTPTYEVVGHAYSPAGGRRWLATPEGGGRFDGDPDPLTLSGPAGACTVPHPLNDTGTSVGRRVADNTGLLRTPGGVLISTGDFVGRAVNASGVAVGHRSGRAAIRAADGTVSDLQDLLDAPSDMVLTHACDVNAGGDVIGYGTRDGARRGFLLRNTAGPPAPATPPSSPQQPLPPPSTVPAPAPFLPPLPVPRDSVGRLRSVATVPADRPVGIRVIRAGRAFSADAGSTLATGDIVMTDDVTVLTLEFSIGGRVSVGRSTTVELTDERSVTQTGGSTSVAAAPGQPLEIQTNGGVMGIRG
jgi:hypothetical protein